MAFNGINKIIAGKDANGNLIYSIGLPNALTKPLYQGMTLPAGEDVEVTVPATVTDPSSLAPRKTFVNGMLLDATPRGIEITRQALGLTTPNTIAFQGGFGTPNPGIVQSLIPGEVLIVRNLSTSDIAVRLIFGTLEADQ